MSIENPNQFEIESISEHQPSFEEQFKKKEKMEVLGGVIEAVDIMPQEKTDKLPILFAPGWGGNHKMFEEALKVISEKGRRVLGLEHSSNDLAPGLIDRTIRFGPKKPRKIENKEEYIPQIEDGDVDKKEEEEKYDEPEEEVRKAFALLQLSNEKNIDELEIIAHSEGAINAIIAASLAPNKIKRLVLINPGGLVGPDKFPKLAGRFTLSGIKEALTAAGGGFEIMKRSSNLGLQAGKHLVGSPVQAINEGIAISESEIHTMLKDLKEKGVEIIVIAGVGDPVFPMDKIQETVKADHIDGFVSVQGGHNELYRQPEKYVSAAVGLLDKMAEREQKEK